MTDDPKLQMARKAADHAADLHGAARGTHTWEIAKDAALAAIEECTEAQSAMQARIEELEGMLGFVEHVGCNYCGAQVALMGGDFLKDIMVALDNAGAPRKSPDGLVHLSMFNRIATLSNIGSSNDG